MVTCTVCKNDKDASAFCADKRHSNGLQSRCKECANKYLRDYKSDPRRKATMSESRKKYQQKIKDGLIPKRPTPYTEARKAACIKYYTSAKGRETIRNYTRNRWHSDAAFRNKKLLSYRIRMALKGVAKSAKTEALLGCEVETAMQHIESKFVSGMSWENQGAWHIDHIKPFAAFDLTDPEQQKQACHYTNLQPLWAADNYKKRDKFDKEHC